MGKSLTLMVDIVSPFSYLAFHVLRNSPVFQNIEITYVPVLLGGIIKAIGNTPPINVPNKREWMGKERTRWAQLFNVPMIKGIPEGFPWSTVQVQRALVAVNIIKPDLLPTMLAELYHHAWVEGKAVGNLDQIRLSFDRVLGEATARTVLDMISTDEVKKVLTQNTQRALESGSFGLPWFIATNGEGKSDVFWGFDHLGQVTDFLGIDPPASTTKSASGWRAML